MSFTVAIAGRPNVGKSTLFNRLVGQRIALVDDLPGVTRDRRQGRARLGDLEFDVIDTAGLDDSKDESLVSRMAAQTLVAVDQADVVLMVMDCRVGVTPLDRHFAELLRRRKVPVILVANKAEGGKGLAGAYEAFELGLGDPLPISAEHGEGLSDLYAALSAFAPPEALDTPEPPPEASAQTEDLETAPLRFAVVGRPNVGKSTLINRWLGEDRLLTGPEAGITRDAIAVEWTWRGRAVRIFDTAGMRRRSKIEDKLEHLSVADTLRAIRFAEVVILVIDATMPFEKQDLTIARLVENEGRSIVIAFDKWDLVENKAQVLADAKHKLETSLPQLLGVSLIPVCGLTGAGIDALMEAAFETHRVWNLRVATPMLNRWLAEIQERHPPPLVDGRRLRLRYMTQSNIRPPTFALFSSKPGDLPDAYRRYLVNLLRADFGMPGVPIRVMLRKGANPYAPKD